MGKFSFMRLINTSLHFWYPVKSLKSLRFGRISLEQMKNKQWSQKQLKRVETERRTE